MFDSNSTDNDSGGGEQYASPAAAVVDTRNNDVNNAARFCKICYETESHGDDWLHPCKCSGTIKWVHRKCLIYWLENAPFQQRIQCSMCKYNYVRVWHLKPFLRWTWPNFRFSIFDGLMILLDMATSYRCGKHVIALVQGTTNSTVRSLCYIVFWRLFVMSDRRIEYYKQGKIESMKKFVNSSEDAVNEAIKGLTLVGNSSVLSCNRRVVVKSDLSRFNQLNVVALISGGGSGHEPFASGFVGKNALAGAVCGDVFASPPSSAITSALNSISGDAGLIVFVLNYTGDRLNFGIAVEKNRSQSSKQVELIYVDDDIALENKENLSTGGRGLAGVSLLIHIVGVFAEQFKMKFDDLLSISRAIIANTATLGVNLEPCALPGQGRMFKLVDDEYELGLGIHGEAGVERKKMASAKEICNDLLERLVHCKRLSLKKNEPIAILLNNLGSVSQLEMGIVKLEVISWLLTNGYDVQCFISGTLMTSIDAHGFSVSILRIVDQKWLHVLTEYDSAVSSFWVASRLNKEPIVGQDSVRSIEDEMPCQLSLGPQLPKIQESLLSSCIENACQALINAEHNLNRLDSSVGDGDCGTSMKIGASAILKAVENGELVLDHPKGLFLQLSKLVESSVGGTSGALYALMLNAAANAFESPLCSDVIKEALKLALKSVEYYAGAKPGHRTLVDPLHAAVSFRGENWEDIVKTVEERAKETAKMEAKAGRASYTDKSLQIEPDPGAMAFSTWFKAVFESYEKNRVTN
ncbi:hypothetical protein niasHS_013430 [Heterodera schachtii]|uniref:Triokinase/FMN cyclase n=1 Tax=Heterodera schachtii TaxID=97005 RepID=A0ABD2IF57_HETSC